MAIRSLLFYKNPHQSVFLLLLKKQGHFSCTGLYFAGGVPVVVFCVLLSLASLTNWHLDLKFYALDF